MAELFFNNDYADFTVNTPIASTYLPLTGEKGLMSSITASLGGDCKRSNDEFLLAPASEQSLHESLSKRNFWCKVTSGQHDNGNSLWSVSGESLWQKAAVFSKNAETRTVCAGMLWHTVENSNAAIGISAQTTTFIVCIMG